MNSLIRLDQVSKRFPNGDVETHALQSVDFELAPGEFVAVIGRSGSGKSTLLNVCAGIERADGGSVEIAGRSLTDASAHELADIRRKHIGVVFQSLNLLPSLTAIGSVLLPDDEKAVAPASNRNSNGPSLIRSPSFSEYSPSVFFPLTKVPLPLPRSSILNAPSSSLTSA